MRARLLALGLALLCLTPGLHGQQPTSVTVPTGCGAPVCIAPAAANSPRTLYTLITPASNSGTNETTLATFSLPGNTLNTDGQALRITVLGDYAATGNTKTVRIKTGTTSLTAQPTTTSGSGFNLVTTYLRLTSTTQRSRTLGTLGSSAVSAASVATTDDLSGAVTITVTGQSDTASNDITARGVIIEWLPAGTTVQ